MKFCLLLLQLLLIAFAFLLKTVLTFRMIKWHPISSSIRIASFPAADLTRRFVSVDKSSERINFVVKQTQTGRLDAFLSMVLPDLSRTYFSKVCDENIVLVNGKSKKKSFVVVEDDIVSIPSSSSVGNSSRAFDGNLQPENITLDILYEDSDLIIVNKPAGLVVHPAPGTPRGTFANALLHHLGIKDPSTFPENLDNDSRELQTSQPNGSCTHRIGIVHRLDKGTTGVLSAGKNIYATNRLSEQFANREVSKTYIAVCHGNPKCRSLRSFIGFDPINHKLMRVTDNPNTGKAAISHIKTIATNGKYSICAIRIETGRTHQIRCHLSSISCPIVGDSAYGPSSLTHLISRPLLHAYELLCVHPRLQKSLKFVAPVPEDIKEFCGKLKCPSLDPELVATYLKNRQAGDVAFDDVFDDKGELTSDVKQILKWDENWSLI